MEYLYTKISIMTNIKILDGIVKRMKSVVMGY